MESLSSFHVVSAYRFYAPIYDAIFGRVLEHGRRKLCESVREVSPARLLEVGVGTGLTLFNYPPHSKVVGVDISDEMLAHAHLKARNLQDRHISLFTMNAEQMDFLDNSFDCVTVPYVLSVTPNPEKLVAELRRVCKPDGIIFILNHFSGSRFWWLLEKSVSPIAHRIGFRSSFHYEKQISAHDWHVESVEPVNVLGLSKLVKIRNV